MADKTVAAKPMQESHNPQASPPSSAKPVSPSQDAALKKKKKLLNGMNIRFTFPSGATYEGSFKDGKIEGYGVYTYAQTGDVYAGEWKADLKHGQGSYKFANGDQYVGQWYMGNKHGKGRFMFANGDEYVGSWRDNQMNGYGVFRLAENGDRYEGYWKGGLRQGRGALQHGNGDLYDGEWDSGQQQGIGVFRQSNGDLYCGDWKAGVMDGKGVLREKGVVFLVEYVGGYLISKLKLDDATDELELEWATAYQHYLTWVEENDGAKAVSRSPAEGRTVQDELDAAHAENSILRKRLEDAMQLLQAKSRTAEAGSDASATAAAPSKESVTSAYWREHLQKAEAKIKLLECTLAERVMEVRKLSDAVTSSEAKLKEFELGKAAARARGKSVIGSTSLRAQPQIPTAVQVDEAVDEEQFVSAVEADELKSQNAILLQLNDDLQRKLTFLSTENLKLSLKHEAAEDQYDKLADEYAELRSQLQSLSVRKADESLAADTGAQMDTHEPESPVALSLESTATMDVDELQKRLVKANQLNIELRLRNGELQRTLGKRESQENATSPNDALRGLTVENESLRGTIEQLQKEVSRLQNSFDTAEQRLFISTQREADLEAAVKTITKEKSADPLLQRVLADKSDRVAKLELENAELARLLDESRATAAEKEVASAKSKQQTGGHATAQEDERAELMSAQKEVKKLQKRLKKVTAERDAVAEQFYDSQVHLARTHRALGALHGRLIVFASLSEAETTNSVSADSIVRIDESDPSRMFLTDCGEDVAYELDYCFGKSSTAPQIFSELREATGFVWEGFQFSVLMVGEFRSGKTTLVRQLFPLVVQSVVRAAEEDPRSQFFSYTYRVAVVEISSRGGFDCASEEAVDEICHDANGYVHPKKARFIDCTSVSISTIAESLLSKRRQHYNGRSHTWIQLQCVRTGRAEQTQTIGRVTFYDWCGPGPLSLQKTDIESARFANASSQAMKDLASALSAKGSAVPYTKSLETSLLFDLLGGNSMTAVIGRLRPSPEHVEESLRTLSVLSSLFRAQNGPLQQDCQTRDEIRWRGLVAALSSDDQAERELYAVENAREF